MQVQRVENNNYNPNFQGEIPKTKLIRKHIDMAVRMAASCNKEEDRTLSKQFFNTLAAMKGDGTNNVLSIRYKYPKIAKKIGDHQYNYDYIVQYGSNKITCHYTSVIDSVIKIGEKLFGKNAKNYNFNALKNAAKAQEYADTVYERNERTIALLNDTYDAVQEKANDEYRQAFEQLLGKRK